MKVDWATHEAAVYACKNWHYSKSVPAAKLVKIGVWEDNVFKGVVIFSMGAQIDLVKQYGLTPFEGCELTRIALRDHKHEVSKIMSIAIRMLRKKCPGIKLIVSFADPSEGHHGGVYQATNWIYSGKSADCAFAIVNGKKIHPRTVSDWLKKGQIKSRKDIFHKLMPGKHRYLFVLDESIRANIVKLSKPFPKRAVSVESGTSDFQSEGGGESPTTALHLENEGMNG